MYFLFIYRTLYNVSVPFQRVVFLVGNFVAVIVICPWMIIPLWILMHTLNLLRKKYIIANQQLNELWFEGDVGSLSEYTYCY